MKIAAFFFPIINTGGFFMELAAKLVFFVFVLNKAAEEVSFKIPRSKLIQLSVRVWKSQEKKITCLQCCAQVVSCLPALSYIVYILWIYNVKGVYFSIYTDNS